ncbi:MAG: chemotaxis protein CheA, partial [Lachnospiraceae bacterium]|nr:chemotaxis protein CheA [Lachnospiraceae bacterium]
MTGELDKLKSGDNPDGDEKQLVADLDEFLGRLKGEIKKQGIEMPQANRHVEPTQFYITPVAGDDSHFYRISIHYRSDTQMSNLRAYSATYALKEVAEDLLYTPDDILSNEASSDVIIAEGFHMLLQTKSSKEEVIALIDSSEAEEINFDELTKQEYGNALGEFGRENVAPAEQPADAAKSDDKEAKKEGPKPGDYVVKTKEAGKGKTLAKNQPKQQSIISVNVEKMDSLMDLIG